MSKNFKIENAKKCKNEKIEREKKKSNKGQKIRIFENNLKKCLKNAHKN